MKYAPGAHKLVHHLQHLSKMRNGVIVAPIHVSVWPTKKCQFNCTYCCCRNDGGEEELALDEFEQAVEVLSFFGTKAIELSGGGEPLLWKHFEEAVKYISHMVKVSLITNGLALSGVTEETLRRLQWIRISVVSMEQLENIDIETLKKHTNVSLSYIVSGDRMTMFPKLYAYSEKHSLVTRIATQKPSTPEVEAIVENTVNHYGSPFFFSHKEKGTPKGCYMAWIRAAIDWRGYFLPCPAIQTSPEYEGRIPKEFRLCHISKLVEWLANNTPRDLGFRCQYCSCGKENNDFVHNLLNEVEDVDFV